MSRAESLHRLQGIDTELDAARRRGKEIDTLLKGTPALQHARSEFAGAETEWKAASAALKLLEEEVQVIDNKVQGEEQRLYAGAIRSPKEMLDVEHEVAALKKRRAGMDDALMAAMERAEQAKNDLAACKAALDHAERNFNTDNVHLREEWNQMVVSVRARLEQRQALSTALPKADLDLYTNLRAKKTNGVAVALIRAGACSQCGTEASSQQVQQARTGNTPALCSNCGRILYAA
jgi:predicted  nucleic acid-binding Zn-ribbon protein